MGYKSIAVIDHDVLQEALNNPEEFVKRLFTACLAQGKSKSVSVAGCTPAIVLWTGPADQTPVLRFEDFNCEQATGAVLDAYETALAKRGRAEQAKKKTLGYD